MIIKSILIAACFLLTLNALAVKTDLSANESRQELENIVRHDYCDNYSINYKRINPTKFKIIIAINEHCSSETIPLNFLFNYNKNWQLYPYSSSTNFLFNQSGLIVQNPNIPDGNIFDTFFKKSVDSKYLFPDKKNLMLLNIDFAYISEQFENLLIVKDDLIYLSLIMEYRPQNIYISGIILSLFSILFMLFFIYKKRKIIE